MIQRAAPNVSSFLQRTAAPSTCAVLTMELQNGIVAGEALFPDLVARVAESHLLDTARRLCEAARAVGVRVVHCTKVTRPDGAGQAVNCKVFALGEKMRLASGHDPLEIGSSGADLVGGLRHPSDFEVSRLHGMTPFTASPLDQILRNLGVRTVVLAGVSLNLGVIGMALSALDLGYQVIIVRDAVAGVPAEYCEQVLEHSLSLIATIVEADDLLAILENHGLTVDLGLEGRRALLFGMGGSIRNACREALESEGARVGDVDPPDPTTPGHPDIVVAGWAGPEGSNVLEVGTAEQLHRAWDTVESSVEIYRESMAGMEAHGWGRFVWVGPASTKSLDSHADDLGAAASLAMLAVNKLVTSEAGASNITANAVLYGGGVPDDDVAAAVCFLCSEGAGYVSGVTITVDGGAGSAMFA